MFILWTVTCCVRVDQVLDIKDGAPGAEQQSIGEYDTLQSNRSQRLRWTSLVPSGTTSHPAEVSDEFFSTFLGDNRSQPPSKPAEKEEEEQEEEEEEENEVAVDTDPSFSNWNSWGDNSKPSTVVSEGWMNDFDWCFPVYLQISTEIQSDELVPTEEEDEEEEEEEKPSIVESINLPDPIESSTSIESVVSQQQGQSSSSMGESSTITESSSSESAQSTQAASSVPSSESTVVGPTTESTTDDIANNLQTDDEQTESHAEHSIQAIPSFPSDKRNVIDSWMNSGESSITEYVSSRDRFSPMNTH